MTGWIQKRIKMIIMILMYLEYKVEATPPGIDWGQWWTYDGISGPGFWGVINLEWGMCKEGRRQSPINIDPRRLLFDPNLTPFMVDKIRVPGVLVNTGHSIEWRTLSFDPNLDLNSTMKRPAEQNRQNANITGGPLSYMYTFTHARFHFGDRNSIGSEHLLDKHAFSAELQVYGFNSQLYRNFSHALGQVYGVVAIALLIKIGEKTNNDLDLLLEGLNYVKFGGSFSRAPVTSLSALLPETDQYMTYEGSLTEPGCHETVTWIIPNKPLYISTQTMKNLRALRQGKDDPLSNAPIANNFRPIQSSNHRTIRTNIQSNKDKDPHCALPDPRLIYKAGGWLGL